VGPLRCVKFHANRCPEVGTRPPKWQKFPIFWQSRPAGANRLNDFYIVRGFYTHNDPALVFHIWRGSLHRLWSYYVYKIIFKFKCIHGCWLKQLVNEFEWYFACTRKGVLPIFCHESWQNNICSFIAMTRSSLHWVLN